MKTQTIKKDIKISEFGNILINALENLNIDPERIAFFALTSKVEHAIRDEIAFYLHKKHGNRYIISREWSGKRHDLAILNKETKTPLAIIEIKNSYSCDLVLNKKNGANYFDGVMNDYNNDKVKLESAREKHNVPIYYILILTNVKSKISSEFYTVIKYPRIINKCFEQLKTAKEIEIQGIKRFSEKVKDEVNELFFVSNDKIEDAFEVGCSLSFFILKH